MKDYKIIWDDLSESFDDAANFVCCVGDEDEIRGNGAITTDFLRSVLQIGPEDKVLEIGCGIARIGRELAPFCREWHGVDISGNMIEYAKKRTADLPNVYLHELPDCSLRLIPDESFDCVYATIVFMHLDKMDMFTYIKEAFRVLKVGGRAYFDTYNLLGPVGWREFVKTMEVYPYGTRVEHMSQFSCPEEMQKFMDEAGFQAVRIDGHNNEQLVVALGRKTESATHRSEPSLPSTPSAPKPAPEANTSPAMPTKELRHRQYVARLETALGQKDVNLAERLAYIRHLEAELERKGKAIAALERRVQQREAQLIAARAPRLPWKRRKSRR